MEQIFKGGRYRSSTHIPFLSQLQSAKQAKLKRTAARVFLLLGGDFLAGKVLGMKSPQRFCFLTERDSDFNENLEFM
ncbi:hypothetical protein [Paenibacillus eucommiae]|uniref:Uncharacterized protein n=1 Tax=Paenibacillus eucommiae TaxID=1355755 RepID=A0ABS4JA60_9BACL|nr:hypothetical protein [Paenibacillus eucommiae]MBP1995981.1 hypothetical protein [Paenibacillus eucommiae]